MDNQIKKITKYHKLNEICMYSNIYILTAITIIKKKLLKFFVPTIKNPDSFKNHFDVYIYKLTMNTYLLTSFFFVFFV